MAAPSTPNNFYLQTGNRVNYLSWDISTGATSYLIQRSTDGVNFTALATSLLNNYLDITVSVGIEYFYQVAASNGTVSPYTTPQSIIPLPGSISVSNLGFDEDAVTELTERAPTSVEKATGQVSKRSTS